MNHRIETELKRLEHEKAELSKQLDIISANIAILYKVSGNGADEAIPSLGQAATDAMMNLKRFNRTELAARVRHNHSTLKFSDASLGKPMKVALGTGKIRLVQANQGNKTQAIYEWVEKEKNGA